MNNPTILLIRHAETHWNRVGRLQGRKDAPLTLNGVRQALAVATALQPRVPDPDIACFWVSPLGRARQTAALMAECWGMGFDRFEHADAIKERAYGAWEGFTLDEVEVARPAEFAAHQQDPFGFCMEGGESKKAVYARIERFLLELADDRPHVIVTHSGVFRAIRALLTGASPEEALHYREPQTSAFLFEQGQSVEIPLSEHYALLFGVAPGAGTVRI